MKSIIQKRGKVEFPEWTGERIYMRRFTKSNGLPSELSRWQKTVNAMLEGIETQQAIYLMVDQGLASPEKSHRRPGVHIDGYWVEEIGGHDGSHKSVAVGSWEHPSKDWKHCDFSTPEGLILASDIEACRAFEGNFLGKVGKGGDCSGIELSSLKEIPMVGGSIYAGNVTMLHESIPVIRESKRTLVRLSIPGWEP